MSIILIYIQLFNNDCMQALQGSTFYNLFGLAIRIWDRADLIKLEKINICHEIEHDTVLLEKYGTVFSVFSSTVQCHVHYNSVVQVM